MKDLIIEQIDRRARLEHGGDFTKAATEYFRDLPDFWQDYKDEVAAVNKQAEYEREAVNAEMNYLIERVAYRNKLDLDKPADRAAAVEKACAEDPGLYKRYADVNAVHVGKVLLTY